MNTMTQRCMLASDCRPIYNPLALKGQAHLHKDSWQLHTFSR